MKPPVENRMKILFTAGSFERGGKEQRLLSLLEDLAARGVEIALIAADGSPNLPSARTLCHAVYDYRPGQRFYNLREHLKAVRDFRPDLIHSWNRSCTAYALVAGRIRCPVITSEITNARPVRILSAEYWTTRFNFGMAKCVLSNSRAGLFAKRSPMWKSRVIYNGYRLNRLGRIDRKKYAHLAGAGGLNVVMAARFSRQKDFETVLRAAGMSQESGLNLNFILAGEGGDRPRIQSLAEKMALKNVTFTGHVPDIDNLLHHMNVGLLATDPRYHQEGIPNSVMECMAHGLPVIVTDGPALPEIVRHESSGYIVRPRNPAALFATLKLLVSDPALRVRMGKIASKSIQDRFDLDAMGASFVTVYQNSLGGDETVFVPPQES